MATRDEFNVSGKVSEEQKIDLDDKARQRKIDGMSNSVDANKARSMVDDRDNLIKNIKDQGKRNIEESVKKAIDENVALKAKLNIKPPKGFVQDTPEQQALAIEHRIKTTMGKGLKDGVKAVRASENKKIDDHISKSLEKERGKSRSSAPKTDQVREQVKASKDSDKKGNEPDRSPSRSRGRQRSR